MSYITAPHPHEGRNIASKRDLVDFAQKIIGTTTRDRCWVVFLTADSVISPLTMPISDMPLFPDEHIDGFIDYIANSAPLADATRVVLLWERPEGDRIYPADIDWLSAVTKGLASTDVTLHGQVVIGPQGITSVEYDGRRIDVVPPLSQ